MICQDPEDIDPDKWLDKGELTELPEAPLGEVERRYIEPSVDQRNPEIQIIPEDPEEIAVREGIHERIQAEIHQGNREEEAREEEAREEEARAEEMLEVPPEWNEVPDLMMEEEDVLPEATGSTKRRCNEVSRGGRK